MLRPVSAVNRRLIVAAMATIFLSLAPAPSYAGCSKSVTMYSAPWCPYCKQVREILARNQHARRIRKLDHVLEIGERIVGRPLAVDGRHDCHRGATAKQEGVTGLRDRD